MTIVFAVTKVGELMAPHPTLIAPDATLQQAAKRMEAVDCGALPVGTENKLVGIITDRDIVIRAIARGKIPAHEKVAGYMTPAVYTCRENDTLEDAAKKINVHQKELPPKIAARKVPPKII